MNLLCKRSFFIYADITPTETLQNEIKTTHKHIICV